MFAHYLYIFFIYYDFGTNRYIQQCHEEDKILKNITTKWFDLKILILTKIMIIISDEQVRFLRQQLQGSEGKWMMLLCHNREFRGRFLLDLRTRNDQACKQI